MVGSCRILVIDDDIEILQLLKILLSSEGYEVATASTAFGGLEIFKNSKFNLVLLDLGLPDLEGEHLCKIVRKDSDIPIIIISAKENVTGKVLCFEYGADDYITKPFVNMELLARVKAVMRRSCGNECDLQEQILYKNLKVDLQKCVLYYKDENIELTPKEFEILVYLLRNKGRIIKRQEIVKELWGKDTLYKWSRSLDVHIQHIRQKLEMYYPNLIKTVSGMGYKLEE